MFSSKIKFSVATVFLLVFSIKSETAAAAPDSAKRDHHLKNRGEAYGSFSSTALLGHSPSTLKICKRCSDMANAIPVFGDTDRSEVSFSSAKAEKIRLTRVIKGWENDLIDTCQQCAKAVGKSINQEMGKAMTETIDEIESKPADSGNLSRNG